MKYENKFTFYCFDAFSVKPLVSSFVLVKPYPSSSPLQYPPFCTSSLSFELELFVQALGGSNSLDTLNFWS